MDINQDKENFVAIEATDREWRYSSVTRYMFLHPCSLENDYYEAIYKELQEWGKNTRDGISITEYLGHSKHVIVPNIAHSKRIYMIEKYAFGEKEEIDFNNPYLPNYTDNINIEEIIISEGIEALEGICYCPNLRNITLPQTLKYIGSGGINDTAIEKINFPNRIKHIPFWCCANSKKLNSVTLPDNVIGIWSGAFMECIQLSSIALPKSLKRIGDEAFLHTGLKYVSIPEGVTRIGDRVFADCRELRGCVIPRSVNHIGEDAFSWRTEEIRKGIYPFHQRFDYFNNPNLVLYVYPGSYGFMWAREHGYPVQNADI